MGFRTDILQKAAALLPAAFLRPLEGPVSVFFHGVENVIAKPDQQINHHALDDFVAIAEVLKSNFEVAPLSELAAALKHPRGHRRTVFLTCDDGYANALSNVAPVLKEFGLPWTLFVSTRHIDTGELNPMLIARTFYRAMPDGTYNLPHFLPARLNGARASSVTRMLEKLRFLPSKSAEDVVQAMSDALRLSGRWDSIAADSSERFLKWDEVRLLSQSGVAIGAHADWHWAMHAGESPAQLQLQAERSRKCIETEIGPCRHFAYPFGNTRDIGPLAWKAVRDAGYEYAFTTLSGVLASTQNPWLLPRYGLAAREPHLPTLLPLLRTGNTRVANWQRSLAQ